MGNDRPLCGRIPRLLCGDLAHARQPLIDAARLVELDDHAVIRAHHRLDIERGRKERLQPGQPPVLAERFQRIDHKIRILLIPHPEYFLGNLGKSQPGIVHIPDRQRKTQLPGGGRLRIDHQDIFAACTVLLLIQAFAQRRAVVGAAQMARQRDDIHILRLTFAGRLERFRRRTRRLRAVWACLHQLKKRFLVESLIVCHLYVVHLKPQRNRLKMRVLF